MKNNRYLIVSPDYPPPLIGGSLVYVHSLVDNCPTPLDILTAPLPKGLSEITAKRHRVIRLKLLRNSHNPSRYSLVLMYFSLFIWTIWKNIYSPYKLMVLNPGVIGNSLLILSSKIVRVPVIVIAYAEELSTVLKGKGLKAFIKQFMLKKIYKKAHGFLVVCDFAKDTLTSLGIRADKIQVLPPPYYEAKMGQACRRTSNTQTYQVLSVGRLISRKGFGYLIDAINLLKEEIPHIKLNIVGGGPEYDHLQKKINLLGLQQIISIKGQIQDSDLKQLYADCDLFVLANTMLDNGDCEGAPLVFIEAGYFGKPVIGGPEGGASTMIRDGINGILVDPKNTRLLADKIKLILTNPELGKKMGAAGTKLAINDHNPKNAGLSFEKILRDFS